MGSPRARAWTVGELAAVLDGHVEGEPDLVLRDVRGLAEAGPEHLSFVANRRYLRVLADSRAGAVLVDLETAPRGDHTLIRVADPYAAFAASLRLFHPEERPEPGVHPLALVHPEAEVDPAATIEAFAVVECGARVGPGAWVQSHAYVGPYATIGEAARLMPGSVVCGDCSVGARSWLNPGAVVGGEGFGFAPTPAGNIKIPQVGRAVVAEDVELGANTCVDRAAMGETRVERGAKLDNLVQVGHAATVGEDSLLVAYSGVAGSSRLGKGVRLGAKAAVLGHISLGDGVQVGVASVVHNNQPDGARITGVPAIPHRTWLRAATTFRELPEHSRRIGQLEARLAALEEQLRQAAAPPVAPATAADPRPPAAPTPGAEMDATEASEGAPRTMSVVELMELLPHRMPMIMVDRVLEVEPGVRAVGVKCVAANEPWFQGHFPGNPVMPGVLVAEAFAQLSGVVALTAGVDARNMDVYLLGVDKLRLRKPITPGDRVILESEKIMARLQVWRFKCTAKVDGVKVAEGEVMATVVQRDPATT